YVRINGGSVFLPPVNEVARSAGRGSAPAAATSGNDAGHRNNAEPEVDDIALDGRRLTTEHIVLPRGGKFSVRVGGHYVADDYPDIRDIWANRMAYTAFLHVGLKKNWILQYSTTRAAEAAGAGTVSRLQAPWPYDIKRPSLMARDLNADALMIHGVLNQAG